MNGGPSDTPPATYGSYRRRGGQLNDRIAAPPMESPGDGGQQQAHLFGNEGALEKGAGVLIFAGGLTGVNGGQVGGELGLLKSVFEYVGMGNHNFTPGFEDHQAISINKGFGADVKAFCQILNML